MNPPILKVHLKKRLARDLSNDAYMFFFLIFIIKAYVVGTHLNCIRYIQYMPSLKSRQKELVTLLVCL